MTRDKLIGIVCVALGWVSAGCGTEQVAMICEPGVVAECPCGGGLPAGTQRCNADGTGWEGCDCGGDGDSDGDGDIDSVVFTVPDLVIADELIGIWGDDLDRMTFEADGGFEELYAIYPILFAGDTDTEPVIPETGTSSGYWSAEDGVLSLYFTSGTTDDVDEFRPWIYRSTYCIADNVLYYDYCLHRTEGAGGGLDGTYELTEEEVEYESEDGTDYVDVDTYRMTLTIDGDRYELVEGQTERTVYTSGSSDYPEEIWEEAGDIRLDGDRIWIAPDDSENEYFYGFVLSDDLIFWAGWDDEPDGGPQEQGYPRMSK